MEGHIFPAEVITNYGVYPVRVILHAEKEAHRAAEHINQLYAENGIDMPCVNEAQIRGFFDVEFYETEETNRSLMSRLHWEQRQETSLRMWLFYGMSDQSCARNANFLCRKMNR